jgi:hypothetical protein
VAVGRARPFRLHGAEEVPTRILIVKFVTPSPLRGDVDSIPTPTFKVGGVQISGRWRDEEEHEQDLERQWPSHSVRRKALDVEPEFLLSCNQF